jgi:hypothetical protein
LAESELLVEVEQMAGAMAASKTAQEQRAAHLSGAAERERRAACPASMAGEEPRAWPGSTVAVE